MTVFKPKNKKLVLLVKSCTMHNAVIIIEETKEPELVYGYNSTKEGVDLLDQMCQNMNHGRKTRRWIVCFFFNMVNINTINANAIYDHNLYSRRQKMDLRLDLMLSLQSNATQFTMHSTLRQSIMKLVRIIQVKDNINENQYGPMLIL